MATGRLDTNQPQDDYVTVPGSILQLSGDDSTSITKLEGRKGKEEKMTNASRWSLSLSRWRLWMKRGQCDGVVSQGMVRGLAEGRRGLCRAQPVTLTYTRSVTWFNTTSIEAIASVPFAVFHMSAPPAGTSRHGATAATRRVKHLSLVVSPCGISHTY